MKYMMLVCTGEPVKLSAEEEAQVPNIDSWVAEMDGRGVRLHGNQLRSSNDATTVRVRHSEVLVADGPFAETKEQIAGFDILECGSLDEAIEIASKHPMAYWGMLEIRPFWEE
jgi:hypothetical protein